MCSGSSQSAWRPAEFDLAARAGELDWPHVCMLQSLPDWDPTVHIAFVSLPLDKVKYCYGDLWC